jgi:hypothetical protein
LFCLPDGNENESQDHKTREWNRASHSDLLYVSVNNGFARSIVYNHIYNLFPNPPNDHIAGRFDHFNYYLNNIHNPSLVHNKKGTMGTREKMTPSHWSRHYLISRASIDSIKKELKNIERNTIRTPDTEANFKNITDILDRLKGA